MPDHEIDVLIEDEAWEKHAITSKASEIAATVLRHLKFPIPCELTVLLTNNAHVQELNKKFRGIDKPTNVLSFPGLEPEEFEDLSHLSPPLLLGDIALALETIMGESVQQLKTFDDHVAHLIVHGTLHLLGYDHEQDDEADAMEALEIEILALLNISNPYE